MTIQSTFTPDRDDDPTEIKTEVIPLFPRRPLQPRPWVVRNHSMKGAVSLHFGDPGGGKSLFQLHMAIAVASGQSWGCFDVIEPGPVMIINREDNVAEIDHRTTAIEQVQPIPEGCPVHLVKRPNVMIAGKDAQGELVTKPFRDELAALVKKLEIKLLILDPMIELAANLSENDNAEMNFLVETLRQIGEENDCAIHIVHHTNKAGGYRGASSIIGRVRCAWQVIKLPENHGLDLGGRKPGLVRSLTPPKNNYGPTADDHHFEIKVHHDEETDEYSPAFSPIVLGKIVDERRIGEAVNGKPQPKRDFAKKMCHFADDLGVTTGELKKLIDGLIGEGKIRLEDRYSSAANRTIAHYRNTMEAVPDDEIPI